jgi:hypothetical protein
VGIATLITWLITVGIGAYMLRTWIARSGWPPRRGADEALPPVVVFGHAGLAVTGLGLWVSFVGSGLTALAWIAAGLLTPVVGLGLAMVTLWTPYPVPATAGAPRLARGMLATPAEDAMAGGLTEDILTRALTDDALAARLADEVLAQVPSGPPGTARKSTGHLAPLIPAAHGMMALTTVLLALVTALTPR